MASAVKTSSFLQSSKLQSQAFRLPSSKPIVSFKSLIPMASLSVSISETFTKLKQQGKVALIPYITAGDPDLSTTAEALKVLDTCGSDIIELGVPYSDPLADGPVIQVLPEISCPVSLFTYYNVILKRGIGNFMAILNDAGVQGLVVPDVPLEETETLRKEAAKNDIEMVLLTTPTTPTERMKPIVEAAEGFVYLVSSVGVTGARASVSSRVQSLLQEIKEIAGWGADGVIVGSAMVKLLGEAKSPKRA
ncbi:hypothetical protein IFM89_008879 [Coptis chinensis]|uniref:tryptophan synthase n=1 Tax=Coptis chinensis TaxID=261450 RepID=A0A835LQR2_9MAGN|nr:hypothetical protein IFM89_008879 [Coptis chinensis]